MVREFDMVDKAFVPGGFEVPLAKTRIAWIDLDHVFVGTAIGGDASTDSGYPNQVRRWTRGATSSRWA